MIQMRYTAKLTPKYAGRVLQLKDYLAGVPAAPEKVYWEYKIPPDAWQMFGNDTIGDCTCACIAHMIMLATAHTGTLFTPAESDIIAAYSAVSGYDPSTGANDNGAAIQDVLNYWQNTGIGGHKIIGWAQIDQTNIAEVKQGIWLFGGTDIGIEVFQSMEDQFDNHQPWDNPSGDDLGGHSIPVFGFGADGCDGVTWATLQQMSWDTWSKICSEAYCVITEDWINQLSGKTYSGFDLAQLQADLAALKA
jgi:hypothetical protein